MLLGAEDIALLGLPLGIRIQGRINSRELHMKGYLGLELGLPLLSKECSVVGSEGWNVDT
jgi:hypothetical protein